MPTETIDPGKATRNFMESIREEMSKLPTGEPSKDSVTGSVTPPPEIKPPDDIAPSTPPPKPETPPTKPVETKPAEVSDDEKWPRSASDWEKRKAAQAAKLKERDEKIKTYETKVKEYEDKLKAASETKPDPEFETIKQEREQYKTLLRQIAVEYDPQFKGYYSGKSQAQIELAKRIVGSDKATQVEQLLNLPDSAYKDQQIETMISDLPVWKQGQLGSVISSLAQLESERAAEIAKSKENFNQLQARQTKQLEDRKKAIETEFNSTLDNLKSQSFLFQFKDGDNEWNNKVNERIELARHFMFGSPKQDQIISAAFNAVAYPAILEHSLSQSKEIESLKSQIAELTKATPKLEGERKAETTETPKVITPPAGSRPMDLMAGWVKNLGPIGQQQQ